MMNVVVVVAVKIYMWVFSHQIDTNKRKGLCGAVGRINALICFLSRNDFKIIIFINNMILLSDNIYNE